MFKASTNVNDLRKQKSQAKQAAEKLINAAINKGVDLTGEELSQYNACVETIKNIENLLQRHDELRDFPIENRPASRIVTDAGEGFRTNHQPGKIVDHFPEVSAFVRFGKTTPEIKASLQEGSSLSVAIPPYQLENFRVIVPGLFPFETAGATIINSESFEMNTVKIPFVIQASTAVSTFAEGAGPSSDQPATVKGLSLTATKYAFLTKLSEEADADIQGLEGAIVQEGISRVYQSTTAAATTALLASLTAASATVTAGADNLESLLDLEAKIPPAFASPNNALMLSRTSLSRLRNTRDLQDRPIFDPVTRSMLGYRVILNDALSPSGHNWIVFGSWNAGVFINYSQFAVQRLLEAYRESGLIGVRFARRFAAGFYSDASTDATVQPLYQLDLGA
jgi:HK97 family phage major capsid protein